MNFIAGHSVPKSMTLEEIQEATSGDPELQAVIKAVEIGKWRRDSPYHKVRQELINTITTDADIFYQWTISAVVFSVLHIFLFPLRRSFIKNR